jgi:hypothetical protein
MLQEFFFMVQTFSHSKLLGSWSKHFCLWSRLGLMIQTFLLMVDAWFYGPITYAYGWSLVLWFKHFLFMVEAWSHGPCNFVYAPSLIVWSKHFCLWSRLGLQSKHFCLWLKFGFMVQALLHMVEIWSYGSSTLTYNWDLVLWAKHFCLWSKLNHMV